MSRRILYGTGVAGALAAAYLLGSLTLGGAFAASQPPTPTPVPATSQASPARPRASGAVSAATPEPTEAPDAAGASGSATPEPTEVPGSTGASASDPAGGADTQDAQPTYTSSVTAPQDQSNANDTAASDSSTSETSEAQALQSKAKVTADQAKAAALAQYPGATMNSVGLDNENGNVVYSVQLTDTAKQGHDVKVDAGTGKVLQVRSDGSDGQDGGSTGGTDSTAGANG